MAQNARIKLTSTSLHKLGDVCNEILGIGKDIANQDAEGIEHHLNPKTIKQLRKFVTFLKSNPKFTEGFNDF